MRWCGREEEGMRKMVAIKCDPSNWIFQVFETNFLVVNPFSVENTTLVLGPVGWSRYDINDCDTRLKHESEEFDERK